MKRLWIRAPLTEEEGANGQMYYSEGNIKSILQTFKPRSDLDRDEFVRRLENAAWLFVNLAAAGKAKPPSTLERDWERRAKQIEKFYIQMRSKWVKTVQKAQKDAKKG